MVTDTKQLNILVFKKSFSYLKVLSFILFGKKSLGLLRFCRLRTESLF